mgnify:CR=1 FL=1
METLRIEHGVEFRRLDRGYGCRAGEGAGEVELPERPGEFVEGDDEQHDETQDLDLEQHHTGAGDEAEGLNHLMRGAGIAILVHPFFGKRAALDLSEDLEYLTGGLHWLDAHEPPMEQHFEDLAKGILGLKDAVYFLSLSFFGLFLAHSALQSRRWR